MSEFATYDELRAAKESGEVRGRLVDAMVDELVALRDLAKALLDWEAIEVAVDALPDYLDPMDPETEAIGAMTIAAWRDVELAMSKVRA